jgi:hypothetical protein
LLLPASLAWASIFGTVQGIVHDAQHRPIAGAHVELHALHSNLILHATSNDEGAFSFPSVALGDYSITVSKAGFATQQQTYTLASDTSPVLHFPLQIGTVHQTVSVQGTAPTVNVNSVTPTTLVDRQDIAHTPGADRTNSMAMITDFTPGAYMTHDMLHMRGGHQLDWQIDGVEIPNTNIASNLAAQIDPKDIDYIEIQRGSYTADVGDRTYGVFNVVPRSGFERNRQAELILNAGNFLQTNDQLNFGDHTEKFAYYASVNGNRSDYGLAPPIGQVFHDADNGYGGFASLIYNRTPKDQLRNISMAREDYFQIPYDPSTTDFEAQQFDPPYGSSQKRDGQHETDIADAFSMLHTFNASTVLQLSPFLQLQPQRRSGGHHLRSRLHLRRCAGLHQHGVRAQQSAGRPLLLRPARPLPLRPDLQRWQRHRARQRERLRQRWRGRGVCLRQLQGGLVAHADRRPAHVAVPRRIRRE